MSSVRGLIDSSPMNRIQVRVLLFCLLCNMVEGYDILSMALASVPLSDEWSLSGSQIGILLAVGPIGMAIGSFTIAPLADRLGRRPVAMFSLAIIGVFVSLSATATDITQLSAYRLVAGVGMGSLLPVLAIIVAEFAPSRKRGVAIGVLSIGTPAGGAIGGALAAVLMADHGWEAAFVLGGALTFAMLIGSIWVIPETPDYLATHATSTSSAKLEALMEKMRLTGPNKDPRAGQLPFDDTDKVGMLNAGASLRSMVMVMVGLSFALGMSVYYFASMWMPKLLVIAGMSTNQGISGVLLLSIGSAAGGALLAVLSTRMSPFALTITFTAGGAVMLGVFSLVSGNLGLAMAVAPLLGLCTQGIIVSLYTVVPALFGPEKRTTAMGIGVGFGRVGTIVMPLLIGALIDNGWSPTSIFQVMIVPCAVIAALIFRTWMVKDRAKDATAHTSPRDTAKNLS